MTKLTLTSLQRYSQNKDGSPLKTRDGRPYTRLVIRAKEYGEKPLSGFDSIQTQNLREGDVLEAEVTQSGDYLNFKLPNKQDLLGKQLEEINSRTLKILLMVEQIGRILTPKKEDEPPYPDEPDGEIPF